MYLQFNTVEFLSPETRNEKNNLGARLWIFCFNSERVGYYWKMRTTENKHLVKRNWAEWKFGQHFGLFANLTQNLKMKHYRPGNLSKIRRSQYDDVRIRSVKSHHGHGKHSWEWSRLSIDNFTIFPTLLFFLPFIWVAITIFERNLQLHHFICIILHCCYVFYVKYVMSSSTVRLTIVFLLSLGIRDEYRLSSQLIVIVHRPDQRLLLVAVDLHDLKKTNLSIWPS